MTSLFWVYPDRSSARQRAAEDAYWAELSTAAAQAGFSLQVVSPESVVVRSDPAGPPEVYVDGKEVTPAGAVFNTDLYAMPSQERDALGQMLLYQTLEVAGFYLPVPPRLALVANDKLATHLLLRQGPCSLLPTVRVQTGRDVLHHDFDTLLGGLDFPLVAKPASWGVGMGIAVVRTPTEARHVLSLAAGADTVMVLQPFVGPDVTDLRVYVVDGQPHTVLRRTPATGEVVANIRYGGTCALEPLPPELAEAVAFAARAFDVPYCCLDFLTDGRRYWLSEVELDGAIAGVDPGAVRRLCVDRFHAYARRHRAWLERPSP